MEIRKCRNHKNCGNTLDKAENEMRVVYQVNYSQNKPKWSNDKTMATYSNLCQDCIGKVIYGINEKIEEIFKN